MKLHLRIFFAFMLMVVLLLLATYASIYSYQKKELLDSLKEKIELAEQSILSAAQNRRKVLVTFAKTIAKDWGLRKVIGQNDAEAIITSLNNHRATVNADKAFFFRLDGSFVSSDKALPPALDTLRKNMLDSGSFKPYQIVKIGQEYFHTIFSEVRAPQKKGWLCLIHSLGELKHTAMQTARNNELKIAIFNNSGRPDTVFSSHSVSDSEHATLFPTQQVVLPTDSKHRVINDHEFVAGLSLLESSLQIAVIGSTESLLAILEKFWQRMAVLFLIISIFALLITYFIAKNITHPLQLLLSTAKELENGNFSTAINIKRTDEIGNLAIAFQKMQQAVFEREQKVFDSLEKLEHQATHDVLTGLPNRRTLSKELELANYSLSTKGTLYCICVLDLDGFKVVNDTSGHAAGDELLIQLGSILQASVYSSDTVVRLGGDEFAILLNDCNKEDALRIANEIRQKVDELIFQWEGSAHRIGASIGALCVSEPTKNTSEILQRADAACFTAKGNGRNQVHLVLDNSLSVEEKRDELHWVQRLHGAMDNDELILFVQPVVPLQPSNPGDPKRLEVLVRLRNYKTGKLVPPGAFIPPAERYGLNVKIDRWVVSQLFKLAHAYKELFDENQIYWINLSGSSLSDEAFVDFLELTLQKSLLPKGSVNFEITETAIIRNINDASEVLHRLKKLGCKFSLDDFGSGLSSFSYLKSLPVDFLKIDGAFIRNILNDRIDRMFVKSIIDIAHEMDIETVAEFIESKEILDEVAALGGDYGQGYALGRPQELLPLAFTKAS